MVRTTVGTEFVASTMPSDPAPPPCPITAYASASGAIADPVAETRLARTNRRNAATRSGFKGVVGSSTAAFMILL